MDVGKGVIGQGFVKGLLDEIGCIASQQIAVIFVALLGVLLSTIRMS